MYNYNNLMKPLIISIIAGLLSTTSIAGNVRLTNNKYVTVNVDIKGNKLKAGSSIEMLISLKPVDGIHINLKPAIELTLDSLSSAALSGTMKIPKGPEYLDTSSPITQRILLAKKVKPGNVALKGMLTYYYCSDKEGWCSKFKQPIEITLTVDR